MRKIKMGIIGLGTISENHAREIQSSTDGEIVALCTIEDDILKIKGDAYGIPECLRFLDYRQLLACGDVDAVSICTPNFLHFPMGMEAIRCSKPFLMEKPVALDRHEARILKETAEQNGIVNMVCFSYRYKAIARNAREIVRQGHLGKIYHVNVEYSQGWCIQEDIPYLWRHSKEFSGSGTLGDLGVHMIDMVRFIVGDFTRICGHTGTFVTQRKQKETDQYTSVDVDDYSNFLAELDGGIAATFAVTRYAFGRGNYQRITLYGNKGSLVYELDGNSQDLSICIGEVSQRAQDYHKIKISPRYEGCQMQSFFDLIQGKNDGLSATLEDGYKAQAVMDAILKSASEQKWISMKEMDG